MITVYLAGPISKGCKAAHYHDFCRAHMDIMRDCPDVCVLNPGLSITMPGAFDMGYEKWMQQCLEMVRRSDVVIRLPGESSGADREVELAYQLGIEVIGDRACTRELHPVETFKIMRNSGILLCQEERSTAAESAPEACMEASCSEPANNLPSSKPQNPVLEMARKMSSECLTMMEAKNADYTNAEAGNSPFCNFLASVELAGVDPAKGILMRISDKMARIRTFVERGDLKVKGEGWADSCNDIYNYAIILRAYLTEKSEGRL